MGLLVDWGMIKLELRQWAPNPMLSRHTNSPPCGFDVGHSLYRTSHELADSHTNTGLIHP